MEKIRQLLNNKKTYLVAAAAALTAIISWAAGEITTSKFLETLFLSAGGAALRAGVSKVKEGN